MDVGDVLAENRHGMIATHIVFTELYAPRRVYPDGELAAVAISDMRLARQLWRAGAPRADPFAISLIVLRPTIHPSASKLS